MENNNYETESRLRLAAYVAIGLGFINIGIILFFALMITRGMIWITH